MQIVKAPSALVSSPDAEAQAAYVENVKSFLTAVEEMGLPTFEQVDLEQVIILNQVCKILEWLII